MSVLAVQMFEELLMIGFRISGDVLFFGLPKKCLCFLFFLGA